MSEGHDDFAFEPVRGLPDRLPEGERILWQGAPTWWRLAVGAFHVRKVAIYFALVAVWQVWAAGEASPLLWLGLAGLASVTILTLLAWLYSRTTVYTLTTRRVVIRSGLALPVTLNLPLSMIDKASLRRHGKGTAGSIALEVTRPNRVAWLVLWPNVRPWTLNHPQPFLRALEDAASVVPLLSEALRRSAPMSGGTYPTPARGGSVSLPDALPA